jgi:hypothetical protein
MIPGGYQRKNKKLKNKTSEHFEKNEILASVGI